MTNFEIGLVLFLVSGVTLVALILIGTMIEVAAISKEFKRCKKRRESREQECASWQA